MRKSTGFDGLTGSTTVGALGVPTWLHASSAFGDTPDEQAPRTQRPWSGEVHAAAPTERARMLVSALIAIAITAMRVVHDGWARYLRGRQARLAYRALRQLDDRGLRDLGLDRSEITSIAAEFAGETPYARIRGNAAF